MTRTVRQRRGADAEAHGAAWLTERGWQVLARNVRIGRDEIDLLAIDPGPPAALVAVEVRSATSRAFGAPEERIDRAKVRHLYRAAAAMSHVHIPATGGRALLPRVDLLIVDRRSGAPTIRHLVALEPG